MQRFSRTAGFLGKEKFDKLIHKKVAVVGLGAVGSYAVEGLARAGVKQLLLVDFDKINPSNINRQLYALESTLGNYKTAAARARVIDINPQCQIETKNIFVDEKILPELLLAKPDLVIDAIDSLNPKTALLKYCQEKQIPVISSMGAALRSDPLKIKIGKLQEATHCPLVKQVKKKLCDPQIASWVDCVYSIEPVVYPDVEPEPADDQDNEYQRGRKRKPLASLPTLTGIFGLIIANCAIKKLTE